MQVLIPRDHCSGLKPLVSAIPMMLDPHWDSHSITECWDSPFKCYNPYTKAFWIQVVACLTCASNNNLLNIIWDYIFKRFRIVCPRRWSSLYLVTYTSEQTRKAGLLNYLSCLLIRDLGTMEGQALLKVPWDWLKQQTQYYSHCYSTAWTHLHRLVISSGNSFLLLIFLFEAYWTYSRCWKWKHFKTVCVYSVCLPLNFTLFYISVDPRQLFVACINFCYSSLY